MDLVAPFGPQRPPAATYSAGGELPILEKTEDGSHQFPL
jgi:hypothetical protein